MGLIDSLLTLRRRAIWERFREFLTAPVPMVASTEDAYRQGLQAGYSEGLVDGVDLGLEVGLSGSAPLAANLDPSNLYEN